MTDSLIIDIEELLKIIFIVFALFHFLAGLIIYREVLNVNRVIQTKTSGLVTLIVTLYFFFLLGVLIIYFFI